MANYPTAHISASPDDFAKTVLMPGDPLRSKFIAENFLEKSVLINNVRYAQGYTGIYKGKKVTVMSSGMGMPSMGIYSYELFSFFGVENIIRIGTAGAVSRKLRLRDVVLALGAATDSNYASQYKLPGTFCPTASYSLLKTAQECAEERALHCHIGNILTSDAFYCDFDNTEPWRKMNILCIDMETAALYMNAARLGKNALSVLTISDIIGTDEQTSPEEREKSFSDMVYTALETAISI